jgi:hypothetical protein
MPHFYTLAYKPTREQRQEAKAAAERQRLKGEQAKRDEFVRSATLACLAGDHSVDLAIDIALRAQRELEKKVPALFRTPKGESGYVPVAAAYAGCDKPLGGGVTAAYAGCDKPLGGGVTAAPRRLKKSKTPAKE